MKTVLAGAEPLELTEDSVLAFITKRRHVTFVELRRYFEGFDGDREFGQLENNVFFWTNMSEEVCNIIRTLDRAGKIYATVTEFLVYLADGGGLNLPLAKRRNFKYKTPRWLPIVWNPISQLVHETVEMQQSHGAYMNELSKDVQNDSDHPL